MTLSAAPWRWPDARVLRLLHEECQARHGGPAGIRATGVLDAVLAQVREQPGDLAASTAALAVRLMRDKPFKGGHLRAVLLGIGLFLPLNRAALRATPVELAAAVQTLVADDLDEAALAHWLREHLLLHRGT